MKKFMQNLGKSMLIPIVAMPIAGILFRLSAEDLLNITLFQAAGVIFENMDVLLAIGIAMGMAKTKDRGIPALTGYLAITVLNHGRHERIRRGHVGTHCSGGVQPFQGHRTAGDVFILRR